MTKISPYAALCDMFLKKTNVENSCQTQPVRDYSVDKIIKVLRDSNTNATETHNINIFHDDNFEILRPDYAAYSGGISADSNPERHQKFKFVAEKPHEDVFPKITKMFNRIKNAGKPSVSKINEFTMTELPEKEIHTTCFKPYKLESHSDYHINNHVQVNALYKTVSHLKSTIKEKCYECDSDEKCLCEHCGAIAVINESLKRPQFTSNEEQITEREAKKQRKHKKHNSERDYNKLMMKLKEMEERIHELEDVNYIQEPIQQKCDDDDDDLYMECNEEKPKLIFPDYSRSFAPNRSNPKSCPLSFGIPSNIRAKFFKKRPPCGDVYDDEDDYNEDYKFKHISREPTRDLRREPTRERPLKPTLRSFGYMYKKTERNLSPRQGMAAFCATNTNEIVVENNLNFEKPTKDSNEKKNSPSNKELHDLLIEFRKNNNKINEKAVHFTFKDNKIKKINDKCNKTEENLLKSILNTRVKMNEKQIQTHPTIDGNFKILQIMEPINSNISKSPKMIIAKSSSNSSVSKQVFGYVNDNYNSKTDLSTSTCFSCLQEKTEKSVLKKKKVNDINLISPQSKKTKLSPRTKPHQKCKLSDSKFKNIKIKNNEYYSSLDSEDLTKSDKEHIINRLSKISTSKESTNKTDVNKISKQKKFSYQVRKSNKIPTYKKNQKTPAVKNPMFFRHQENTYNSSILSLNECKTKEEFELIKPLMIEKSTELSIGNLPDLYRKYSKPKIDLTKQTLIINNIEPLFQNNDSNSLKSIIIFNQPHYNVPYMNETDNTNEHIAMHANISQEAIPSTMNNPYTKPVIVLQATIDKDSNERKYSTDNIRSYTVMDKNSSEKIKLLRKVACHKCKKDSGTDRSDCKLDQQQFKQNRCKTLRNPLSHEPSFIHAKEFDNVSHKTYSKKNSVISQKDSDDSNTFRSVSQFSGEIRQLRKIRCDKCKNDDFYNKYKCRLDQNQFILNKCKSKLDSTASTTFADEPEIIETERKSQSRKSSVTILDGVVSSDSINQPGILTKVLLYYTSSMQSAKSSKNNNKLKCEKCKKNIRNQDACKPRSKNDSNASMLVHESSYKIVPIMSKESTFKKKCSKCTTNSSHLVNKKPSHHESIKLAQSTISIDTVQIKSKDEISAAKYKKCEMHSCQLSNKISSQYETEEPAHVNQQCFHKTQSLHSIKVSQSSTSNAIKVKDKHEIRRGKCNKCQMKQISSHVLEEINAKCTPEDNKSNSLSRKSSESIRSNYEKEIRPNNTRQIKQVDSMNQINKQNCTFNCMKTITSKFSCKYFKNLYGRASSAVSSKKGKNNYCEFCCGPNKDKNQCQHCKKKPSTVDIYFNVQGQHFVDDSDSSSSDDNMILTANEKQKYLLEKLHLLQNYRDLIMSTEKSNYGEFE